MSWLTATEALALLAVRPQTLYANVSRGRIRARPDPDDPRRSLYSRRDVEKLAAARSGRPRTETVAAQTMAFGEPVLPSALSTIAGGRLWYRGQDAVELAASSSLEAVAALLWDTASARFERGEHATARVEAGAALPAAFRALAIRAGVDAPTHGRAPGILREEAADIVATLAAALIGQPGGEGKELHRRVAARWDRPAAADPIRRALVLLADHELNASTFATRVAASTGASLAASVLAGLATLTGPLHGGAAARVRALVTLAESEGPEQAIRATLARGERIAAFGHPIYPGPDPRAAALLASFPIPAPFVALAAAGRNLLGEDPNIDFALAALAAAHALPDDAPLVLFALARSVGWLAHALEQVGTGHLIRPRARYVGLAPAD